MGSYLAHLVKPRKITQSAVREKNHGRRDERADRRGASAAGSDARPLLWLPLPSFVMHVCQQPSVRLRRLLLKANRNKNHTKPSLF